ncbi:hypothetical protein K503DRAFT_280659 [Rhizopogon vinicolor AM-OR11-026]|uniref:Uncharacterized protein n=1 Tax=Rhizopogon vinicolor AM-OR11-026 TaxID=1314800 RepID=A0A1B7MVW8_9AGAM|nr:hypothetical protein K503DRAFT_280659 [Rhizopogon vinicolor AM-OR11-026]
MPQGTSPHLISLQTSSKLTLPCTAWFFYYLRLYRRSNILLSSNYTCERLHDSCSRRSPRLQLHHTSVCQYLHGAATLSCRLKCPRSLPPIRRVAHFHWSRPSLRN